MHLEPPPPDISLYNEFLCMEALQAENLFIFYFQLKYYGTNLWRRKKRVYQKGFFFRNFFGSTMQNIMFSHEIVSSLT